MSDNKAAFSPFGVKTLGFTVHDLPSQAQHLLQTHGQKRRYRLNEEVQRLGEVPSHASWLLSGRLRCAVPQQDGTEVHGGWIMPQEIFGINSLILGAGSRTSMYVDTPECEILHFSLGVLRDIVLTQPEMGLGVAVGLSKRLRQQFDMIDVVGHRNLGGKLRTVLQWWATHHGIAARDGSVELWVGQGELATGVGASRQRVHAELKRLRASGEVELGYRKVILYPRFFDTEASVSEAGARPVND